MVFILITQNHHRASHSKQPQTSALGVSYPLYALCFIKSHFQTVWYSHEIVLLALPDLIGPLLFLYITSLPSCLTSRLVLSTFDEIIIFPFIFIFYV